MASLGQKIRESRKRRGMLLKDLGAKVGLSSSTLSDYEHDKPKGGVDPQTLIRIAAALDDLSILAHFCGACPVRRETLVRRFPELGGIGRRGPALIAGLLRREMEEGLKAVERLGEVCADPEFETRPDRQESFRREMVHVLDVKNCIETLEWELLLSGIAASGQAGRQEEHPREEREGSGRPAGDEGET